METFEVEDDRDVRELSFTEKAFFNNEQVAKLQPKKVVVLDCPNGMPEAFPDNRIVLMKGYKSGIERGRKDPLKNRDVLAIMTDKGPFMLPLDEAEKFSAYLYSIANSLNKKLDK